MRVLISSVGSSNRPCLFTRPVNFANNPDVLCIPFATSATVSLNTVFVLTLFFTVFDPEKN